MKIHGPWEKDLERKALQPPLDFRERLRLGLKVPIPFVAYLWFQQEQSSITALTAFAAAVGGLSFVELLWLRTTRPSERIFTRTRRQAALLHGVVLLASAAALVYAIPRLP